MEVNSNDKCPYERKEEDRSSREGQVKTEVQAWGIEVQDVRREAENGISSKVSRWNPFY
jgi:hypothetical protein